VTEGGSFTLDGSSSTDVDQGDTLTYSWDLNGDGVFGDATGVSPTVTWNQLLNLSPPINNGPATFNVAVRVDDGSGPVTSPAVSLTVNNGPPTVSISGPGEAVPNFAVPLNLIASDPSPADQAAGFRYEVDFGDGTAPETYGPGAPGNQPVEHAFTSSGTFTVRVTAFDVDGAASATALHTIRVIPIAQVGDEIIVGGSETLNDRIIIQSGRNNSIFVRVNNERFGPFDSVPTTVVRVFGGGGDDRITVSNCITTAIHGEAGNDYVAGGPCADEVHGGEGRDKILLGEGNNWGYGDGGNDYIAGRSGNDVMFGGAGNDVLLGSAGLDQLFGEGGNDLLSGGNQGDLLSGGLGNDRIDGGSGDDVAVGNIGNDQLIGGAGRDLLVGGSGRDALQGNEDQDRLIGGEAENDEDLEQLLTLALNWRLDGNTTSLGSLNDDSERDGLNGGSASDELFFGLDDVLTVGREDVVTPM
jgi:Ca2+-binding RTX toxin-like protein